MNFRDAVATDHLPIARLHAASWRTAYRGALSDEYLARNVMNDRSAVWDERLHRPKDNQIVIVSHSGEALLGFACAFAPNASTKRWAPIAPVKTSGAPRTARRFRSSGMPGRRGGCRDGRSAPRAVTFGRRQFGLALTRILAIMPPSSCSRMWQW
jgi:hypothetical protein